MAKQVFTVSDFSGGVVQDVEPGKLEDNQLYRLVNAVILGKSVHAAPMTKAETGITVASDISSFDAYSESDTDIDDDNITEYMARLNTKLYRGTGLYKWGEDILYSNSVNLDHAGVDIAWQLGNVEDTSSHTTGTATGFALNVYDSQEGVDYIWLGTQATQYIDGPTKLGYVDTSCGSITQAQGNKYGIGSPTYSQGIEFQNPGRRFLGSYHTQAAASFGTADSFEDLISWYTEQYNSVIIFRKTNNDILYMRDSSTPFRWGARGAPHKYVGSGSDTNLAYDLGSYDSGSGMDISDVGNITIANLENNGNNLKTVYFRVANQDNVNDDYTSNAIGDKFSIHRDLQAFDVNGKDMYIEFSLHGVDPVGGLDRIQIALDTQQADSQLNYDNDGYAAIYRLSQSEVSSYGSVGDKIRIKVPLDSFYFQGSLFSRGNVRVITVTWWAQYDPGPGQVKTDYMQIYELSFKPTGVSSWTNKSFRLYQSEVKTTPIAENKLETLPVQYGNTVNNPTTLTKMEFQVWKSTDGTNGNLYWQESDNNGSPIGSKFLLAEVDDTSGVKPVGQNDFIAWDTDNVKFTSNEAPVNMTYSLNSGYPQGTEEVNAAWRHSAVVGRTVYIGHVKQPPSASSYDKSLILKSAIGKPYGFSDKTYIDIETGGADGIRAMIGSGDRLYVFTSAKLFIINVAQDFEYMEATFEGWGVHRRSSVCNVDEGIAFVTNGRDVVYFDGSVFDIISDKGMSDYPYQLGDGSAFHPMPGSQGNSADTLFEGGAAQTSSIYFEHQRRTINVYDFSTTLYQCYDLASKTWIGTTTSISDGSRNWTNAVNHITTGGTVVKVWGSKTSANYYSGTAANILGSTNMHGYMQTKFYDFGTRALKKFHNIRITGGNWLVALQMKLTIYKDDDYDTVWIGDMEGTQGLQIDTNFPIANGDKTWILPADVIAADAFQNSTFRSIAVKIDFYNQYDDLNRINRFDFIYSEMSLDNEGQAGEYT